MKKVISAFLLSLLIAVVLPGCEREGPAEQAGEEVDEAVEQSREKAEEAGEEIEEMGEDVQEQERTP